eukprot:m.618 g.618  ORF g.618 m.618 type:complete len:612 (-) comp296_c0_seq1:277-2112(-)
MGYANTLASPLRSASALAAISNVEVGLSLGWNAARYSHQQWWHKFYPASFITLTDSKLESFYWIQMYKLASATRGYQHPGPTYGGYDHTGPWFTPSDTCCPLFNWDMNFPVQYQVIFSSNHPELGLSMTRLLSDPIVRSGFTSNVDWIVKNSTMTDADLVLSGPYGITGFRFVQDTQVKPPAYACNLLWVLVNFWNLYRATMDETLLPDLYAVLRGSVNHQVHLATKTADGTWHLPPMDSPEYPLGAAGGNTNYQLALFKWGLRTLLQICDLMHCDEPRRALFEDIAANLAAYPVSSNNIGEGKGLMISANTPVNTSHRHYSHMLPCWNTGMLSWDVPEEKQLCLDTLDNWHAGSNNGACVSGVGTCVPEKDMTWEWDGFSYPASSSFNTRASRADAAWGNLTLMLNAVWPKKQLNWGCPHTGLPWPGSEDVDCIGASMQPNTFQGENGHDGHADPTSETPLAMATSVQDMLLFSDDNSNSFRVFYGIPTSIAQASFYHLRAAGAFLVSGERISGTTTWIHIVSLAGSKCTMFAPPDWESLVLETGAESPQVNLVRNETSGAWDVIGLGQGEEVLIAPKGKVPDNVVLNEASGTPDDFNWWGQHPGGAGRD